MVNVRLLPTLPQEKNNSDRPQRNFDGIEKVCDQKHDSERIRGKERDLPLCQAKHQVDGEDKDRDEASDRNNQKATTAKCAGGQYSGYDKAENINGLEYGLREIK